MNTALDIQTVTSTGSAARTALTRATRTFAGIGCTKTNVLPTIPCEWTANNPVVKADHPYIESMYEFGWFKERSQS